jgi:hypothetical protein
MFVKLYHLNQNNRKTNKTKPRVREVKPFKSVEHTDKQNNVIFIHLGSCTFVIRI